MNKNAIVVELTDGRQVCTSYGVPVAAFVPGRGYVRTADKYSVTTSKHANAFAGKQSAIVSPDVFASLIDPIRKTLTQ